MVKQRFVSNFDNVFRGKIYFFLKKSLLRYIILALIFGFLKPINELSPIVSAIIYFAGVNIILWPLQYLSAKILAKKIEFDAIIEFDENEIKISHNNKDLVETKDWTWIKKIETNKERVWLTLNQSIPFAISIPKVKLSSSDIALFEKMEKVKNNLKG